MGVGKRLMEMTQGLGEAVERADRAPATTTRPPVTGPGRLAEFSQYANEQLKGREEAEARARELEAQLKAYEGTLPVRKVDSARVRHSKLANRDMERLEGSASFQELLASIEASGGNEQPIRVRPVKDASEHDYEVVYGHRRLFACQLLKLPVKVLVEDGSDREVFEAMTRENLARQDLSAWELGVHFQRGLDAKWYSSQNRMAQALGISQSQVSRAIAVAALPAEVLQAFGDPRLIQYEWGAWLREELDRDRDGVLGRARELAARQPALPASEVLAILCASRSAKKVKDPDLALEVKGRVVGHIRLSGRGVEVKLARQQVEGRLEELQALLTRFLAE